MLLALRRLFICHIQYINSISKMSMNTKYVFQCLPSKSKVILYIYMAPGVGSENIVYLVTKENHKIIYHLVKNYYDYIGKKPPGHLLLLMIMH